MTSRRSSAATSSTVRDAGAVGAATFGPASWLAAVANVAGAGGKDGEVSAAPQAATGNSAKKGRARRMRR